MQTRDDKARGVGEHGAIHRHLRALALVVRLFVELLLGGGHQLVHLELGRGETGDLEQGHDIVDIAVDRLGDARVLHLDRQLLAIAGEGLVDLTDAGGGDGARVEPAELLAPLRPPFGAQHLVELLGRHEIGLIAQGGEDFRELLGQEVARIEADHLPHLHRRAAQVREAVGHALDIAGGEDQVARADAFPAREPPRAFSHHPARNTANQPPEGAQPRYPARRHGPLAGAIFGAVGEFGGLVVVGHGGWWLSAEGRRV